MLFGTYVLVFIVVDFLLFSKLAPLYKGDVSYNLGNGWHLFLLYLKSRYGKK